MLLETTRSCAGIVALFAFIRLFTGVGSHVASKGASLFARVVALCTNKGLLSAVNHLLGFQLDLNLHMYLACAGGLSRLV